LNDSFDVDALVELNVGVARDLIPAHGGVTLDSFGELLPQFLIADRLPGRSPPDAVDGPARQSAIQPLVKPNIT